MAGKDGNGLVISLSIFVLLSVGLGVAWYMTWSHSADLQRQLAQSTTAENSSKATIQEKLGEVTALKDTVGLPGAEVSDVVNAAKAEMAKNAGDGTSVSPTLSSALTKAATDRDIQAQSATDRMAQLQQKIDELKKAEVAHNEAMQAMKASLDAKEQELLKKERDTAETISNLQAQVDKEHKELLATQDQLVTLETESRNKIEALEADFIEQRKALVALRREKNRAEGTTFERADGSITYVDHSAQSCFVDLGEADGLRVGTTFSIYGADNSGVGRNQSKKDIKGKIEVVTVIGDHLAEARIVEQKNETPLAEGDQVYSPLFAPGQSLQLACVGKLEFDGNAAMDDREQFRRLVTRSGAEIVLEVNDEAKVVDKNQAEINIGSLFTQARKADELSDLRSRFTTATRFLVVGDLGDENTEDVAQKEINNRVRIIHEELVKIAEFNGVYIVSLSSFLDYIGYSRGSLVYSPSSTLPFPGKLANGAASSGVNASSGSRQSSAVISSKFSERQSRPMESLGATSKIYQDNARNED